MGAKHANWFVTSAKTTGWLRETELVPKTQGIVSALKETRFALALARRGKVPIPFPPHVAEDVKEARALYNLVKEQDKNGAAGIVQGEKGLGRIEFLEEEGARVNARRRSRATPLGDGLPHSPRLARDHAARAILGARVQDGRSLRPCIAWCSRPRHRRASPGGP